MRSKPSLDVVIKLNLFELLINRLRTTSTHAICAPTKLIVEGGHNMAVINHCFHFKMAGVNNIELIVITGYLL